ncbi:MAG: hypothetical protein CMH54_12925 [Myxococcales bacterium]|nr:hypothetical protein [Myxococcales bacterium]
MLSNQNSVIRYLTVAGLALLLVFAIGCESSEQGVEITNPNVTQNNTHPTDNNTPDPNNTDPTQDPIDNPDPNTNNTDPQTDPLESITLDELSVEELEVVTHLRGAISLGLDVGRNHYVEEVELVLEDLDVIHDFESELNDWSILEQAPATCPFVEFYNDGDNYEPSGITCEYMVDLAKVEAYSELTQKLDSYDLPTDIPAELIDEARGWYEEGAISGLEQQRILVRSDLRTKGTCYKEPTVKESSTAKGITVGRQLFAQQFNEWLLNNGYVADYPTMSQPIQVCNVDQSMLDPAYQNALQAVAAKLEAEPLCENYQAPTQAAAFQYGQAQIDYEKAVEQGVEDEHALASVVVFEVVPCNVSDPIVVDLDNDGIELLRIFEGPNFDMWSVDRLQAVGWVHPDDAFLAYDRDGNGSIDNGSELFGNVNQGYADGFAQLAELDMNGDGEITEADPVFGSLLLWQDSNSDGISDVSELRHISAMGITSIPCAGEAADLQIAGNRVAVTAYATSETGPVLLGDAFLRTAPHAKLER